MPELSVHNLRVSGTVSNAHATFFTYANAGHCSLPVKALLGNNPLRIEVEVPHGCNVVLLRKYRGQVVTLS